MPKYTLRKNTEMTLTVDAESLDAAFATADMTEDDEGEHTHSPVTCDEEEEDAENVAAD